MIKINLLPQEMVGGAGRGAGMGQSTGTALVATVLIVLFGLCAALGGFFVHKQNQARTEYQGVRQEADLVKAELDETREAYEATKLNLERMERLIKVAQALDPADRLLWSRKLNMLPSLVPEGVYLTEIRVSQEVKERETDESIRRRNEWTRNRDQQRNVPQPPVERIPVITQTLQLQAIAYVPQGTSTQRLQQFNIFYKNLQGQEVQVPFDREPKRFLEGFQPSIRPSALLGKRVEGRDVSEISFTLTTTPLEIR